MALEIERRFIIKGNEWKAFIKQSQELEQGYFSTNFEEWIVRMRMIDRKKSQITLKALAGKMSTHEFEYSIPLEDAVFMWNLISKKLKKKRYFLNFGPGSWVVDCFEGSNFPLVLAEVELNSEKVLFEQPSWCSQEVTGIKKLSNASLAQYPITDWSQKERLTFQIH
ncbi:MULTISPECIES: CYTH domain-containing protein [Prochlorococcus]|uniref:Uncharacterized conserved protein n=1 Tax=Prochlorococcus marinus (strain SARG / CCMP1375 / SS120) TaxID=167539 RepID=Q7VE35_PROMA|nr:MULTISPECIES: CYTH domain-containing protein [Prochlorococcus]AAP99225.1 Uncharacterized conserved protein [Prochlorococcus marinus subsp. marinus str. CCMP1375]KGG11506.1 hypothetical protein EV04_1031 [Prochlorococcus marinus str. LG]KGG18540.1 hypothetical protein EV08_1787 [Prochlorococcus marinus str. SS2]KGG22813.1 hypothetical protein EV09_1554 [Prochlorococcus marinus str. SS35]KGG32689.1 hypothetical protein EV10_1006 [Prochlorococcus marinus str. SS51]